MSKNIYYENITRIRKKMLKRLFRPSKVSRVKQEIEYELNGIMKQVTDNNKHELIEYGKKVGKEII